VWDKPEAQAKRRQKDTEARWTGGINVRDTSGMAFTSASRYASAASKQQSVAIRGRFLAVTPSYLVHWQ